MVELSDNFLDQLIGIKGRLKSPSSSSGYTSSPLIQRLVSEISDGTLKAIPLKYDGTQISAEEEAPVRRPRSFEDDLPSRYRSSYEYSSSGNNSMPKESPPRLYELRVAESGQAIGQMFLAANYVFDPQGVAELVRNVLDNPRDIDNRANLLFYSSRPGGYTVSREPRPSPETRRHGSTTDLRSFKQRRRDEFSGDRFGSSRRGSSEDSWFL